jgi:hypothetical protein
MAEEFHYEEVIDHILAQRQANRAHVESRLDYLQRLKAVIVNLAERCTHLAQGDGEFQESIRQTREELQSLATQVDGCRQAADLLNARFRRETLKIAVIGQPRVGKSRLLRTLTGLPEKVIPDQRGLPCTGVRSDIYHALDVKTHGKVMFHSEATLQEVIRLYWVALKLPAPSPVTLREFIEYPLPVEPPETMSPSAKEWFAHLHTYRTHLPKFTQDIRNATVKSIAEDDIIEYVAQRNANFQIYNFLAVQRVEIVCTFPFRRVGKIAFIDLPGIGESALGHPERMIAALKDDADIALFVMHPRPGGDYVGPKEFEIYEAAQQALQASSSHTVDRGMHNSSPDHTPQGVPRTYLPLGKWAYLVINHRPEIQNTAMCHTMLDETTRRPMGFFGRVICDCSKESEVEENILRPVLRYLSQHLLDLDQEFADACSQEIRVMCRRGVQVLAKAQSALGSSSARDVDERFGHLFRQQWRELKYAFNKLVRELAATCNQADADFSAYVTRVIEAYERDKRIPNLEQANKAIMATSYGRALDDALDELRADLANRLRELDQGLDLPLQNTKAQVVAVLREAGRLAPLMTGEDPLATLSAHLPPQSPIRLAIENLYHFQMSARGLIGFKIRAEMYRLMPKLRPDAMSGGLEEALGVQMIYDILHGVWQGAVQLAQFAPGIESLAALAALVSEESPLRQALVNLHHFQEVVGMGESIRKEIAERLLPKLSPQESSELPEALAGGTEEPAGELLVRELQTRVDTTIRAIRARLAEGEYNKPNQCAYAIVADFVDAVLHTAGMEVPWFLFYKEHREQIFRDVFARQADLEQLRAEWVEAVSKVQAINNEKDLVFSFNVA